MTAPVAARHLLPPMASVVAGLALASAALAAPPVSYPLDVAVAPDGALLVADRALPGLWRKAADGEPEALFRASAKFGSPLNAIRCVAVDPEGKVLAGDSTNHEIFRLEDGQPQPLTAGRVRLPMDIAVDSDGTIYVADLAENCVWRLRGEDFSRFAELRAPVALHVDSTGALTAVSRVSPHLLSIDEQGKATPLLKSDPMEFPHSVTSRDGAHYVVDGYAKTVWKVTDGKAEKWAAGPPLDNPVGSTWLGEKLIVADSRAAKLWAVTAQGVEEAAAFDPGASEEAP